MPWLTIFSLLKGEQRRVVAKVELLMVLADPLGTLLAACRAAFANLLSALVAQIKTDEGPMPPLKFHIAGNLVW